MWSVFHSCSLLIWDWMNKEKLEYSEIIQANSTDLIQLVNDVLDLSRLELKDEIPDTGLRNAGNMQRPYIYGPERQ